MQRVAKWLIDGDWVWEDFDGAPEELQYPMAVELMRLDFGVDDHIYSLGEAIYELQLNVDWEPYVFEDEEVFDLPVVLIKGTKLVGVVHKWDDDYALVVFVENDKEHRLVVSWEHLNFIDQITIKHKVASERRD